MNDRENVIMSETRGKREDAFTPIKVYPSGTSSSFSFRFILIIEKKKKNENVIGKQQGESSCCCGCRTLPKMADDKSSRQLTGRNSLKGKVNNVSSSTLDMSCVRWHVATVLYIH